MTSTPASSDPAVVSSGLLRAEVVLVVAIATGLAATRSVLRFLAALTAPESLPNQTATLNSSQAPGRPWIDLGLQLVFVLSLLLPVMLVFYLLRRSGDSLASVGLRSDRMGGDVLLGAVAAAAVGGVGLGGYLLARELGAALTLVPTSLPDLWWRVPILVLASFGNAALEEVVEVGYLGRRLRQLGHSPVTMIALSASLRGLYHLYQGLSGFVGNVAMGLIFATYFQRTGRIVPLIVAHTLIDVVAFVGYLVVAPLVTWL